MITTAASYLRGRISDIFARVLRAAPGQMNEPLYDYEKARIGDFMNDVNAGRITFEEAQQAIEAAWIASYRPSSLFQIWRSFSWSQPGSSRTGQRHRAVADLLREVWQRFLDLGPLGEVSTRTCRTRAPASGGR